MSAERGSQVRVRVRVRLGVRDRVRVWVGVRVRVRVMVRVMVRVRDRVRERGRVRVRVSPTLTKEPPDCSSDVAYSLTNYLGFARLLPLTNLLRVRPTLTTYEPT